MKRYLLISSVITSMYCSAQKAFQPENSILTETADGDLDGDHVPEKVNVYTIKAEGESGEVREIQILKKINQQWTILEKSTNAILDSDSGGMMGDPFSGISIEKGILIISHFGGSSWKWAFTDKYRYQNGHFELIGYTGSSGRPGDYMKYIDFNLSTGQLNFRNDVDDTRQYGPSQKETYIKKGVKINLQNRGNQRIKIVLPKTREEISI
ncbi:MAG: hypothetical protein LBE92_21980 [Chryseobacterium sp.]|jgi:hypothetical protein|uniref:hypothetical protein n=1 Tax=Chryseobacterium sp. TaxID=1871047 RepID=UPI00281E3F98|nr:hypothetical protein [Chryseobacterium sp.]MDR2238793.1 hypothetical protein [Chryseobacterium sp.]